MSYYAQNNLPPLPPRPTQEYSTMPVQQYQYGTLPTQQYHYPRNPLPQQYSMTHNNYAPAPPSHGTPFTQEIILFTTPVSTLKAIGLTKPIDIVAHWTLCINGWCYELSKQRDKKEKYHYRTLPLEEWKAKRTQQRKTWCADTVGKMARPYSHDLIHEVAQLVWATSLHKKYAYDEKNCQVFLRLLVELIGDATTKAKFPVFLDAVAKAAGNTRDGSFFAFAAGASIFAAGVCTLAVDPTGTTAAAAAGFSIAAQTTLRSSAWLLTDRDGRGKAIQKGQKEIREEMRRRGRPLAEPEGKKK